MVQVKLWIVLSVIKICTSIIHEEFNLVSLCVRCRKAVLVESVVNHLVSNHQFTQFLQQYNQNRQNGMQLLAADLKTGLRDIGAKSYSEHGLTYTVFQLPAKKNKAWYEDENNKEQNAAQRKLLLIDSRMLGLTNEPQKLAELLMQDLKKINQKLYKAFYIRKTHKELLDMMPNHYQQLAETAFRPWPCGSCCPYTCST